MTQGQRVTLATKIAQVAHEANRAYCATLGDFTQAPWEEAPDWQRSSAINGVLFQLSNMAVEPSASHENWLQHKRAEGWTYGPVKDPEKKQHPCMVPYHELPVEQRRKDSLFTAIVRALAPKES